MNNENNRKIGVILSYISIITSTLVQLIYTPFLIKKLGQSEYGLFSLVNSLIGYLTVLDLGFGNAIVVFTSKYRAQKKYDEEKKFHGMMFIILSFIGFFTAIIGIILLLNVNYIFGNTMTSIELHKARIMVIILTFNMVITFIFSIYSCIINAYEKFIFQKVMSILNTLIKPLLMIPFLFLGYKSITMVIIITIVNICILLLNYYYCKKKLNITIKYRGFDKKIFKTIINYSIWIFLGVIVDKINWSVDQIVLGSVAGTVAVAVYSIASQINTLFINLSTAVSSVLLPKMSKMISRGITNEQITDEFVKVGRIQYYIVFLLASGITLFGKEFFISWVGKEYITSYYITLILIIPLCIPLIQNLGISIMQAKNMHKFRSILLAIIAIINLFISIPLAKMYGGIGSAIGTAFSILAGNGIIINVYYYRKLGINIIRFWKEILKISIPNIIPIIVIILIMNLIHIHGFLNVLIFGGIYTLMYCMVNYFINANEYEKKIINHILTKIHLKKAINN